MAQPTADQVQMANEVLAGTREITGTAAAPEPAPPGDPAASSPASASDPFAALPEQDRQEITRIGESYQSHLKSYEGTLEPYSADSYRFDPAKDQFERSPEQERQEITRIGEAYQNDLKSYEASGQPYNAEAFRSDLSRDQFERGPVPEDIQRVQDVKGPGE